MNIKRRLGYCFHLYLISVNFVSLIINKGYVDFNVYVDFVFIAGESSQSYGLYMGAKTQK